MDVKFYRSWLFVAAVVCVVFGGLSELHAQLPPEAPIEIKPDNPPAPWPTRAAMPFNRGGGFYYSLLKLGFLLGTFWAWVKLTDFLAQDVTRYKANYALWNPIFVGSFFAAFLLMWIIPIFWIGWSLMLVALIAPGVVYARQRNPQVSREETIFTTHHLRRIVADIAAKFGAKLNTEKLSAADQGAQVKFTPKGGEDQQNQANLVLARQSPGFVPAKELIAEMLTKRVDSAILDYSASSVGIRYQIDGVWHTLAPKTRLDYDPVLIVLKKLGNLNDAERRARQAGEYEIEFEEKKRTLKLTTQGMETGERAVLTLIDAKKNFKTLEELGMRPKLIEQWKEIGHATKGFILVSAPPQGGGFTTLFTTVQKNTDRFLRDFVSVMDKTKPEPEIENVNPYYFDPTAGESPLTIMPDLIRRYPNCYVLPDLIDKAVIEVMLDQIETDHLIYGGIKARESAEAVMRLLMMQAPQRRTADGLLAVMNMRIIRKLCEKCREAYAPGPDLLRKLGLPAAQVPQLYKARTIKPEKEPNCPQCDEKGYFGRTGIIEVLFVGDNVRNAIVKTPQLDAIRAAARKDGMRTLQEEGILLVAKGVTSLEELMRVMKPPEKTK